MHVLDTNVLLFDAYEPARIGRNVRRVLDRGASEGTLVISDITLWEVAMLAERGRTPIEDPEAFLHDAIKGWQLTVQPITIEIALLSVRLGFRSDPADLLIAATSVHLGATLITSDERLRAAPLLRTLW